MENPSQFLGISKEDPQSEQTNELISFSKKNGISGDELFAAYQFSVGLTSEELNIKEPRKEVIALAKKIEEYTDKGLALNRVAELISTKKEYDSAPSAYYAMVNSMKINDKGKKALISIVEKRRSGTITVYDAVTSKIIGESKISKEVENVEDSQNQLAMELTHFLSQLKDRKIEIMFSE